MTTHMAAAAARCHHPFLVGVVQSFQKIGPFAGCGHCSMVITDALPLGLFRTQSHDRNVQPRKNLLGGQAIHKVPAWSGGRPQKNGVFLLTVTRPGFHVHQ